MDIRIERLDEEPILRAWVGVLERGDAGVLVTPLAGAAGRVLVGGRTTSGTLGSTAQSLPRAVVDRVATAQPLERGDDPLVIPADDHQQVVDAGLGDLPDGSADDGLAGERHCATRCVRS